MVPCVSLTPHPELLQSAVDDYVLKQAASQDTALVLPQPGSPGNASAGAGAQSWTIWSAPFPSASRRMLHGNSRNWQAEGSSSMSTERRRQCGCTRARPCSCSPSPDLQSSTASRQPTSTTNFMTPSAQCLGSSWRSRWCIPWPCSSGAPFSRPTIQTCQLRWYPAALARSDPTARVSLSDPTARNVTLDCCRGDVVSWLAIVSKAMSMHGAQAHQKPRHFCTGAWSRRRSQARAT